MGHVHESGAQGGIVGAVEGVEARHAHQVDVVGDEHDVAGLEGGVQAASGVGHDEGLHTQGAHDADWKGHLLHGVALVEVGPPPLDRNLFALQPPNDQIAGMPLHGGDREVGNLGVGDGLRLRHLIGQGVQPGAGDEADGWPMPRARPDERRCFLDLLSGEKLAHHHSSSSSSQKSAKSSSVSCKRAISHSLNVPSAKSSSASTRSAK